MEFKAISYVKKMVNMLFHENSEKGVLGKHIISKINELKFPSKVAQGIQQVAKVIEKFIKGGDDLWNSQVLLVGGTNTSSFDSSGRNLHYKEYIEELVPIKDEQGRQLFIAGRFLKPHVDEWQQLRESGQTEEGFSDFMAKKLAESPALQAAVTEHRVRYFSNTERQQTEVHILQGGNGISQVGLDSPDNRLKTMPKGTYAFVLADVLVERYNPETNKNEQKIERKFYATPKVKTEGGRIQHSSFMRGGTVKCAGMLEIDENGHVAHIRNQSGHYRPTAKEIAYLIKHLKDSNYDISKVHVNYYKNDIYLGLDNKLGIKIPWGIVNQRADRWLENVGNALIKDER